MSTPLTPDEQYLRDLCATLRRDNYNGLRAESHGLEPFRDTAADKLIRAELAHQLARGATTEGDAKQTLGDFLVYAIVHLDRALATYAGFPIEEQHAKAVGEFAKVAALFHAFANSREASTSA